MIDLRVSIIGMLISWSCFAQDALDQFLTKVNGISLSLAVLTPGKDSQGRTISSVEIRGMSGVRTFSRVLSSDGKNSKYFIDGTLFLETQIIDPSKPNAMYRIIFAYGKLISNHFHEKSLEHFENGVLQRRDKFGDRQLGDLLDVLSPERKVRELRSNRMWDFLNTKIILQGRVPKFVAMAGGPAGYVEGQAPPCRTIRHPIYQMPDGTQGGGDVELVCPPVFSLNSGVPVDAIGTTDGNVYRIQMIAIDGIGQLIAFQALGDALPRLVYRDWRTPVEVEVNGATISWRDGVGYAYSTSLAVPSGGKASAMAALIVGDGSLQQTVGTVISGRTIVRKEN